MTHTLDESLFQIYFCHMACKDLEHQQLLRSDLSSNSYIMTIYAKQPFKQQQQQPPRSDKVILRNINELRVMSTAVFSLNTEFVHISLLMRVYYESKKNL